MGRTEVIEKAITRFPLIATVSKTMLYVVADAIFQAIILLLQTTSHVEIRGFGSFSVVTRKARTGRNPKTGEPVEIPERKAVKFTPGKVLKAALRGD